MLKINLIHLFDPSGIYWLNLGGQEGDTHTHTHARMHPKKTVNIWGKSWWEQSQDRATLRPHFFPLPGQKLPTSTHQENSVNPWPSSQSCRHPRFIWKCRILEKISNIKTLPETSSKPPIINNLTFIVLCQLPLFDFQLLSLFLFSCNFHFLPVFLPIPFSLPSSRRSCHIQFPISPMNIPISPTSWHSYSFSPC